MKVCCVALPTQVSVCCDDEIMEGAVGWYGTAWLWAGPGGPGKEWSGTRTDNGSQQAGFAAVISLAVDLEESTAK